MSTSGTNLTGFQVPNTSQSVTDRGTTIQKPGQHDDQNTFLKILTAELSNQDPTSQNQDPTAYISQLAQFSALEQMTNLNSTMTLNGATSLIGQKVEFDTQDAYGNNYIGTVKSISKSGDNISLNVDVGTNGQSTIQKFDYSDIVTINPDTSANTNPSNS